MALSRPRTTRVLRGSTLGLGLIVVAGATVSPALAMGDGTLDIDAKAGLTAATGAGAAPLNDAPAQRAVTGALTADFGLGKELDVQVLPTGPVPEDLDLSGAEFLATQTDASPGVTPATGTCVTDQFGSCSFTYEDGPEIPQSARFPGTDDALPAGLYSLVQVSSTPGLDPIGGSASFEICSPGLGCFDGADADVENASLFRTSITTVVTDQVSGAPLAGASYELTGPDYPHQDAVTPDVTPPAPLPTTPTTESTTAPSTTTTESTATESTTTESTTAPTTTEAPVTTAPTTTEAPVTTTESTTTSSTSTEDVSTIEAPLPFAGSGSILRAFGDTVSFGTQVSDAAGSLTFDGFFLPGTGYTLTPVTGVDGYRADTVFAFAVETTSAQAAAGEAFPVSRALVPTAAAPSTSAAPTTSAAPVVPGGVPRPGTGNAALATTGSPVETMTLLGLGMLALGGAATATGTVLRRRARQHS
ncbi:hypothetical protein ASG36_18435 [Geodermatophilus sp. Leaf369]|uniref:hypothetical protein n=1 Tax=Geodermatophilus sp. Leaf369 TaxID=1736354 RepID=UPI0006F240D0|nr:hypothetical protein [Geodermatophilus sp. Leaf369]KQS56971.1 hypothetical protein ASG36_18435 [Geodermatophilus sp. Leaf369]